MNYESVGRCEVCQLADAIYYDCSCWPPTYVCRCCLEAPGSSAAGWLLRMWIDVGQLELGADRAIDLDELPW
jgi:hypothetical protein